MLCRNVYCKEDVSNKMELSSGSHDVREKEHGHLKEMVFVNNPHRGPTKIGSSVGSSNLFSQYAS